MPQAKPIWPENEDFVREEIAPSTKSKFAGEIRTMNTLYEPKRKYSKEWRRPLLVLQRKWVQNIKTRYSRRKLEWERAERKERGSQEPSSEKV